jgi:hypothetical protein
MPKEVIQMYREWTINENIERINLANIEPIAYAWLTAHTENRETAIMGQLIHLANERLFEAWGPKATLIFEPDKVMALNNQKIFITWDNNSLQKYLSK